MQKFSEAAYCLPSFWQRRNCFKDELLLINLQHGRYSCSGQHLVRAKQTRSCAPTSLWSKGTTRETTRPSRRWVKPEGLISSQSQDRWGFRHCTWRITVWKQRINKRASPTSRFLSVLLPFVPTSYFCWLTNHLPDTINLLWNIISGWGRSGCAKGHVCINPLHESSHP